MANEKKKHPLGVPETRGSYELAGLVVGTDSERFYAETNTKSNKPRRVLNFAVQYDKENRQYVELAGMEQKSVFFTKSTNDNGKRTTESVEVPWNQRKTYKEEGFRMIGVSVGLETELTSSGVERNKNMTMVAFDASEYASQHLTDGMPVFVRGNITYSTYNNEHRKRFELNQISRSTRKMDFEDEKFEPTAHFQQVIVYMGVEKREEDKRYVVSAKVVTYNSVEDVEYIIEEESLARTFKKGLKPYTAIEVFGDIRVAKNEEEVQTSNVWGTANKMKRKRGGSVTELVITGADAETIDTEAYSEDKIEEAIRKAKNLKDSKTDYGEEDENEGSTNWGKGSKLSKQDDNDEDEEW